MIARSRTLKPELLDQLPPEDPEAQRSRQDLRRINLLMGNERWILRSVRRFPEAAARGITELGAGDGNLAQKFAHAFPEARVTAHDLAPRPDGLDKRVTWRQGDILEGTVEPGGVLVANLFLHHFEGEPLARLGSFCREFEVLVFNEPNRALFPHALAWMMAPWINRVTRHDVHVSIRAGFQQRELGRLLGLKAANWQFQESQTMRGALRALVCRL